VNADQFLALLWLRWRLTCNRLRRQGTVNYVISLVFLCAGLACAGLGALAGVAGGLLGLTRASPLTTMLVWDVLTALFLFFWTLGLVTQIQKSEIIDLRHLLHLPISLREAFLLNYGSSLFALSAIFFLPAMLGLALGHALGAGPRLLLLFPLVLSFFFMVTAWTYCLQGWLAAIMENPRRRRTVAMVVTMAFVLLAQLPNLANMAHGGHSRTRAVSVATQTQAAVNAPAPACGTFERLHPWIPLLWLPHGARALAQGKAGPAVWGALGMFALGAWGLARAYRTTLRHYRGDGDTRASSAPVVAAVRSDPGRTLLVERTLPMIPDDVAAMALANLRSLLRAPEVKMTLGANTVIILLFGSMAVLRLHTVFPVVARPFAACAAAGITFLGLAQLMSNLFGFDRSGFRALVLLPTPRRNILLGKNLSLAPLACGVFAVCLALVTVLTGLGPAHLLLAAFAFGSLFLIYSALGNVASVLVPFRIPAGSLRAHRVKGATALLAMLTNLLFTLAGSVIFVPPLLGWLCETTGWLPGMSVSLAGATLLTAVAALGYWFTLEPVGRLLQARERKILEVVTQEIE